MRAQRGAAPPRLLPVAVETIKEKFVQNIAVIDRLYEEKRALEEVVSDLAERLHIRENTAFQPWWEYDDVQQQQQRSPRSRGSPRSPRQRHRHVQSGEALLLTAEAAAERLFGGKKDTRKDGASVGLSRHLQADNDKFIAKMRHLDDVESREAAEEARYQQSLEEKKRHAASNPPGPFKGLEKRRRAAQERAQQRASDKAALEALQQEKVTEERRRTAEERESHAFAVEIPWEVLQENEDASRRERIELRKMKLYAESSAPAAAKPKLILTQAPAPMTFNFSAPDPKRVVARLQQQQLAFGRKLDDGRNEILAARNQSEQAYLKRSAKPDLSFRGQAMNLSKEKRARRLQEQELRAIGESRKALLEEKEKLERILNDTFSAQTDGRRLNKASELRLAATRDFLMEKEKENSGRPASSVGIRATTPRDEIRFRREVTSKEKDSKQRDEQEETSGKWKFDDAEREEEDKAVYDRARLRGGGGGGGGGRGHTPRGSTLIERHEEAVSRAKQSDLMIGIKREKI